jgi:hypothetical protein
LFMRAAISACAAALEESVAINKTTLLFHDSVLSLETIGALGALRAGAWPNRSGAEPCLRSLSVDLREAGQTTI